MSIFWNDGTSLYHWGISGMKWGTLRWQNEDGSFNDAGKVRYGRVGNGIRRTSNKSSYQKDSNGVKHKNIVEKNDLDRLYNDSACSFEGMAPLNDDERKTLIRLLNQYNVNTKNIEFNTISGKTMNTIYRLTGDNAYSDNFHILSLTGLKHDANLGAFRARYGCRWFDDIVDNNERREQIKR